MTIRIKLAIGTIIWWLTAIPGVGMAMMAPMMFDAPGSQNNLMVVALAVSVFTYPVAAILAPILAWVAYGLSWPRAAWILILAPLLPMAAVFISFAVLEFGCGGMLSCHG